MSTKTVNLTEDAYGRLASLKREGESFSDVVNRLTAKHALLDLIGVLRKGDAKAFRQGREDVNSRARDSLERSAQRLR